MPWWSPKTSFATSTSRRSHEAVAELIWPVTTSTITTVVVFLPLGLLTGVEGQFFRTLSATLTIAVLVSLVLALTLIPLLSAQYLTVADADTDPGKETRVLAGLGRAVMICRHAMPGRCMQLHHPGLAALIAAVLVASGVLVYRGDRRPGAVDTNHVVRCPHPARRHSWARLHTSQERTLMRTRTTASILLATVFALAAAK